MANTLQAKKRAHQSEVRRRHNASQRSAYRTAIKKIIAAIDGSDYEAARSVYKDATPVMDKLTAKGIAHKNTTARHKARLNAKINALRSS